MGAIRMDRDVEMTTRDGVTLRADVWRPDDEEAYPAIVERTPYSRERAVGNDFVRPDRIVPHGYAMVIQDTRGRFGSDGVWEGMNFGQESLDAYDTVEWAADQPWCDGKVALYGVSYPGNVAWMGAFAQPPHLTAIAPAMTVDPQAGARRTGGAFLLELFFNWVVMQIASDVLPKRTAEGTADPRVAERIAAAQRDPRLVTDPLPLKDSEFLALDESPIKADVLFPGHVPPVSFPYELVNVPAMLVGGWFDVGTPLDHLHELRTRGGGDDATRMAHRAVIGPWVHALQLPHVQGELSFGVPSSGHLALFAHYLDFFDRHLKGIATDRPAVRYFHMGVNEWRDTDAWPPAGAEVRTWYLDSGGSANTAAGDGTLGTAPAQGPPDRYTYDPADPVRTSGGRIVPVGESAAGPVNQQHLESRRDVLCYTSEVFGRPVDLVGPVRLHLYASSSARDTDFVGKLIDVFPDGRSILVCEGLLRARFRRGFDTEVFLEPGSIEGYDIDLGQTAWRVKEGHRLRVHVTSSNFPAFDRNLNTGNRVGHDASGVVAEQTVHHGPDHPSRLDVTVLPG